MNDTIAAISTTLGVGAISIIRISGKRSIEIVNSLFHGKNLLEVDSHTINYGFIKENDKKIDEVLISVMKSPRTFTTENIVEINCHGGIATTNKILELLLSSGIRLAEPGEFTKRAFLNGRIDLVNAESIMDLITVKTETARRVAMNGLEGNVSLLIKKLRQNILELLASIEVNIDYPEYEDAEEITNNKVKNMLVEIENDLNKIIKESDDGRILTNGIKLAIVGKPNVGKSSILNKLLNEDRAIVTDIAGTTRDIVEGTISLDGILLQLIDTAGIRETEDIVEKIGVDKSLKTIEEADLILAVFNNQETLTAEDLEILERCKDKKVIIVINKSDLPQKIELQKIKYPNIIFTNTVNQDGIDNLKEKIRELFNISELEQKDYTYLSNARQISLAKIALESLKDANKSIEEGIAIDMIELDIKRAWENLGEIIGENYSEELLDQLFSQFCLGK